MSCSTRSTPARSRLSAVTRTLVVLGVLMLLPALARAQGGMMPGMHMPAETAHAHQRTARPRPRRRKAVKKPAAAKGATRARKKASASAPKAAIPEMNMRGMSMPAMKRATPDSAAMRAGRARPTSTDTAHGMANMPGMSPSAPHARGDTGRMRDTMPMRGMPGMRDTSAAHGMPGMRDTSAAHGMPGMDANSSMAGMTMMTPDPLGVSMDRMGSGTTWVPDAAPIPSLYSAAPGGWDVTGHGFAFLQYDRQGGARGGSQVGSLNWMMLMASHSLAGGRVQARTMLSLDALTVTPRGYPLLLQSGEAYDGAPLHDRQHPHDFFMELSALYEKPITQSVGIMLYAAPSGEPALGPVAFMHRPSAMDNPTAPISHHWSDATHISFGVLSAGLFTHTFKLEGSLFNGREPDQYRFGFDPIRLDSWSGRITWNPSMAWSFTSGYGYLASPEALAPEESMHRITASALHGTTLGRDGQWASSLVYGANRHSSRPGLSHSVLLESEAVLDTRNTVFGRAEYVQKSAEDLVLDVAPFGFASGQTFNVGELTMGYIRDVARFGAGTIGLGAMGTLNVVPSALESAYGSRTPLGGMVFVRVRPFRSGMTMRGPSANPSTPSHAH